MHYVSAKVSLLQFSVNIQERFPVFEQTGSSTSKADNDVNAGKTIKLIAEDGRSASICEIVMNVGGSCRTCAHARKWTSF